MADARLIDPAGPGNPFQEVAAHLRAGGIIAYPTETVYGFGCALREEALDRLHELKGRDPAKPFLILVTDHTPVPGLLWDPAAERLADEFWPGPLTIALPAGKGAPQHAIGPEGTIAVRCTPHPIARRIIDALGEPITSTSANRAGQPPASSVEEVRQAISEDPRLSDILIVDGGRLEPSAPSTIVSFAGARPHVVRRGAVPVDELRRVLKDLDD